MFRQMADRCADTVIDSTGRLLMKNPSGAAQCQPQQLAGLVKNAAAGSSVDIHGFDRDICMHNLLGRHPRRSMQSQAEDEEVRDGMGHIGCCSHRRRRLTEDEEVRMAWGTDTLWRSLLKIPLTEPDRRSFSKVCA